MKPATEGGDVDWSDQVAIENPLVTFLWGDDDQPLNVIMLRGFLGPTRTRQDGTEYVLLYLDPEFREHREVPVANIRLHLRFAQGDSSPLDVDGLWVDALAIMPNVTDPRDKPGGGGPGAADGYRPRRW
jgi:hypothetical protein